MDRFDVLGAYDNFRIDHRHVIRHVAVGAVLAVTGVLCAVGAVAATTSSAVDAARGDSAGDTRPAVGTHWLDGAPAHFMCGTITVSYDPTGSPGDMTATVRDSVERWSAALGRPFRFVLGSAPVAAAPHVTIAWAESLGIDVAGDGGPTIVDGDITGGSVTFALDSPTATAPGSGPGTLGEISDHELGHVAGLDHASGPGSRMSTPAGTSSAYSPEEVAALGWVGDNPMCNSITTKERT